VRGGLKLFSDWPTFPQLYAEGDLVGGCDIVLEMHRSGELRKLLEKVPTAGTGPKEGEGESWDAKLKKLIASSPTMLFMKVGAALLDCLYCMPQTAAFVALGSFESRRCTLRREHLVWPATHRMLALFFSFLFLGGLVAAGFAGGPECGFSRRVVAALQEEGVTFGSFDILSDEAVRQGLETLSEWPTDPQVCLRCTHRPQSPLRLAYGLWRGQKGPALRGPCAVLPLCLGQLTLVRSTLGCASASA